MTEDSKRAPDKVSSKAPPRRRTKSRRARLREHTLELVRSGRLPAFILSVGLGVILYAFAASDDFLVDEVVVRGNSIAYADAVVEHSEALGQPLFQINTWQIAESAAEHPAVDSARVRVELPDRVVVNVVEREPVVVWQTGDRSVLIDEYGWVLAEGESEDLPWVVEVDGTLPQPGTHIDPGKIVAVRFLSDELGSEGVLEFDEDEGFQAHLNNDRVVLFGSPDDLPVKMEVVGSLAPRGDEWTRLDVRDPERPVYQ